VSNTAQFINESKRNSDNIQKIKSIQDNMIACPFELCISQRKYIREGLVGIAENDLEEPYLFLFSDMIIVSKYKQAQDESANPKFKFKYSISTTDIEEVTAVPTEAIGEEFSDCSGFEVVTSEGTVTFVVETNEERESWINDIKKCISDVIIE